MSSSVAERDELGDIAEVAALGPILAAAWHQPQVDVLHARRLSAGASRLTWAVDVRAAGVHGGDVVPVVLQRERTRGLGRSAVDAEAGLLRAAVAGGVPVPEVIAWDADGEALGGAYIVTSRIEGETLPRRILRDAALEPARGRFAAECGTILAAIHAIDPDDVGSLPEYDPIEAIEAMLDASGDPRPVFELGLRWLRAHRPPAGRRAVVHGDFRNGNLIIGPEGVRAVLDWELAHIGDPLEDLGWLCVRAWRYGAAPLVGGMGTQRELLDAYARAGGPEVTEEVAFWWLLLGTVRWGVMCLEQARTHLSGESRSVELAVIGRRAAEVEYDVLRMLP